MNLSFALSQKNVTSVSVQKGFKCNVKKHPSPQLPVKIDTQGSGLSGEHLGSGSGLVLYLTLLSVFLEQFIDCGFVYWKVEISNSGKQIYIHIQLLSPIRGDQSLIYDSQVLTAQFMGQR